MKKILSILISLSMFMSSMTMISAYAEETVQETTNVVWIGGSYAAGAGHEQKTDALPTGVTAMPFAKQVTDWIAENSEETVNYYNVAIGGTTSSYGRNRFEKDVLSKDPDIVFIEFTGNDDYLVSDTERVSLALEGMIRATQAYEIENDKEVKIAFLYRPWFATNGTYNLNRQVIGAYHAIADYYDVYEIDAAEEAKNLWEADGVDYSTMVSTDGAHPTALGHYYTGKAMINILEENPITSDKYRSLPMNVNYTEISPAYIDASDASYIDSENTTFTADGTTMVSEAAGDKLTYKFKGTSIGVVSASVSATVVVNVDGSQLTNFSAGSAQALCNAQDLSEGEHTLEIVNNGGGKVVINNIIVDGIANGAAEAKESYTRSIYEDTCMSLETLEGRTVANTVYVLEPANVSNFSGLYRDKTLSFYNEAIGSRVIRYQLSGTSGWGENSNITNVNVRYLEYISTTQKYANKNIVVKAIDKDGNILKTFDEEDCSYEMQSATGTSWRIFDLKVYNVPTNATGIGLYLQNSSNTSLTNVKIAYADIAVDSVSLNVPKLVTLNETAGTSISQFTNNGQTEELTADASVSYSSSDEAIATVDENGVISGIAEGTADITATVTIGDNVFKDTKSVLVKDIRDYSDTEANEKPANLIANKNSVMHEDYKGIVSLGSSETVDGKNARKLTRKDSSDCYEWSVFNGTALRGASSIGQSGAKAEWVNFDKFTPNASYVFATKVKNASADSSLIPYIGNAVNSGVFSSNNTIGSTEYKKTGMAVDSTDWMDYKSTFVFPNNTSTDANVGQIMFWGLHKNSPVGSAAYFSTDDLYLAEEVAYDMKITSDKEKLGKYGSISFNAEVVNQIGIPGKLDQTVEWVVLSQDRLNVIDTITVEASGNDAVINYNESIPAGVYTIVAVSDTYGIIKGIDFEVVDEVDYNDTAPKAIPENLITSGWAIDGISSSYVTRVHPDNTYEQYIVNTVDPSNNVYTFHGSFVAAKANISTSPSAQYVNLQGYEAGKTYVYQALVKNMNADYTPYYGIAHPNNKGGHSNNIGSNTYGKTGMAVTSTDWMLFRDTITYPNNYDSTVTDYNGQVIYQGARVTNTEVGASVAVKKSAVDTSVEGSMETGGLYLAEEAAISLEVTAKDNNPTLALGSKLELTAQVLNQIEIPGKLDQNVEWVVLTEDRSEVVDTISLSASGNTATLAAPADMTEGKYTVVAISETYGFVKGITIDVKEDLAIKYQDYEQPEMPDNLIADKSNVFLASNSAKVSLGSVTTVDGKNARKLTQKEGTAKNAWNIFNGAVLRAAGSVGQSGASTSWVNFNTFTPKTSYVFATKVKNAGEDTTLIPYVGNTVNKGSWAEWAAVGSVEYGKTGMAVESTEWTDYKSTFIFPTNNSITDPDVGSVMYWGIHGDSPAGSAVYFSTDDLYLAEEIPYSLTNTITQGSAAIVNEGTLTLSADLTNQLGTNGSLVQNLEWVALTEDRSAIAEGITVVASEDTKSATVTVQAGTEEGKYVIAVYSPEYIMAKGVEITVTQKKDAQASLTLSQDSGYTWISDVSVSNAECEKVMLAIAAYSKDTDGNLTLLNVTTENIQVTDGAASLDELWLGGDDSVEVPSGTIVKAFVWEDGTMKPIALTENSISKITIAN